MITFWKSNSPRRSVPAHIQASRRNFSLRKTPLAHARATAVNRAVSISWLNGLGKVINLLLWSGWRVFGHGPRKQNGFSSSFLIRNFKSHFFCFPPHIDLAGREKNWTRFSLAAWKWAVESGKWTWCDFRGARSLHLICQFDVSCSHSNFLKGLMFWHADRLEECSFRKSH